MSCRWEKDGGKKTGKRRKGTREEEKVSSAAQDGNKLQTEEGDGRE
jgi:hypothetical protein